MSIIYSALVPVFVSVLVSPCASSFATPSLLQADVATTITVSPVATGYAGIFQSVNCLRPVNGLAGIFVLSGSSQFVATVSSAEFGQSALFVCVSSDYNIAVEPTWTLTGMIGLLASVPTVRGLVANPATTTANTSSTTVTIQATDAASAAVISAFTTAGGSVLLSMQPNCGSDGGAYAVAAAAAPTVDFSWSTPVAWAQWVCLSWTSAGAAQTQLVSPIGASPAVRHGAAVLPATVSSSAASSRIIVQPSWRCCGGGPVYNDLAGMPLTLGDVVSVVLWSSSSCGIGAGATASPGVVGGVSVGSVVSTAVSGAVAYADVSGLASAASTIVTVCLSVNLSAPVPIGSVVVSAVRSAAMSLDDDSGSSGRVDRAEGEAVLVQQPDGNVDVVQQDWLSGAPAPVSSGDLLDVYMHDYNVRANGSTNSSAGVAVLVGNSSSFAGYTVVSSAGTISSGTTRITIGLGAGATPLSTVFLASTSSCAPAVTGTLTAMSTPNSTGQHGFMTVPNSTSLSSYFLCGSTSARASARQTTSVLAPVSVAGVTVVEADTLGPTLSTSGTVALIVTLGVIVGASVIFFLVLVVLLVRKKKRDAVQYIPPAPRVIAGGGVFLAAAEPRITSPRYTHHGRDMGGTRQRNSTVVRHAGGPYNTSWNPSVVLPLPVNMDPFTVTPDDQSGGYRYSPRGSRHQSFSPRSSRGRYGPVR